MPLTNRQIFRRRRIAVFGGLAVALGTVFYLPFTLLAPLTPVSATVAPYVATAQAVAEPAFPAYGASGVGAVGFPGVLASSGTANAVPIASITKVVTSLVVLDAKPLTIGEAGPTLTFGEIDEQFYASNVAQDGVVEPVAAGQTMSQYDALSVTLLASANNYAQSIATWAFGNEAAFVAAANAWVAEHGLTSTTITDPTGILPTNTSSVADLIELAKLALADPVISAIVAQPSLEVPGIGLVENRNTLLGVDNVDGIKTGTLDEAGACLLFSADYLLGAHTVTVVGVVLGGPDHETINASIRSLLATAVAGFHEVKLASIGAEFAQFTTPWGDRAEAVAAADQSVVSWSNTPVTVSVSVDEVRTGEAGEDVGDAVFTVGDQQITVDLELDSAIADPGPWWRLGNPGLLF